MFSLFAQISCVYCYFRAPLNGASPFLKSVSTESLEACGVGIETASTSEESSSSAVRPTPAFHRILCRKKHKSGSASPLPYPPLFPSCHTTPVGRPRSCTTGSTPSVRLEFPFSHLSKFEFYSPFQHLVF